MSEENINQDTLRDALEAGFSQLESKPSTELSEQVTQIEEAVSSKRARDDKGRFASANTPEATPEQQPSQEPIRPKGWKKDYWAAYDKLNNGEPLTPEESKAMAAYALQRENEFASGVSTYKSEAAQVQKWNEVVAPMLNRLQQHGISPTDYMGTLVNVDNILTNGSPRQKIQALSQLAQNYGIPLSVLAQSNSGQVNPAVNDLLSQIQWQNDEISKINAWRNNQETSSIEGEINKFKNSGDAPHFDSVRETMGKLLEAGLATDLKSAYDQAVYLVPEVRELIASTQQTNTDKIAAAQRAKNASVSLKQSAPRGDYHSHKADPSDLRAMLEAGAAELL